MFEITDVMSRLASGSPIFHSEADFQHKIAQKIAEILPEARIQLEVSSGRLDRTERIDLLVKHDDAQYALELKYKKRLISVDAEG